MHVHFHNKIRRITSFSLKFYSGFIENLFSNRFDLNMKPLVTCRQMLTWFCAYPVDPSTSLLRKSSYIITTVFVFMANVCSVASSVAFALKFMQIDLKESLYSVFQIAGSSSTTCAMIIAFSFRFNIAALFENLSNIYNKSKGSQRSRTIHRHVILIC